MAGHIDDIIDPAHDEDVAVLVDETRIAGGVVAGIFFVIGVATALVGVPQGGEGAGGHRQFHRQGAFGPGRGRLTVRA